jgi:aminoglycoside N3'-acetyltransferase
MHAVTRDQLLAALKALGLQPGDGLLVHSAVQFLGRPVGGVTMYLDAASTLLEGQDWRMESGEWSKFNYQSRLSTLDSQLSSGTLAVPTFNFAFARGEPYDPRSTPSQGMGAFSEHVRQLPQAHRTAHPMQSLAVIGRYAGDLAGRDTPSAFDPGSAFERLLELDFKLLLLGADVQAVSMVHYSEQRLSVPYRYWKDFTGQIKTPDGSWQTRTYRMFARDLEINPQLDLSPIQRLMQQRGQWRSVPVNYGQIASCRLSDFVRAADDLLSKDPWSLVQLKVSG